MELEVVLAAAVFSSVVLLALCADAALITVAVKAIRRGRSDSSSRS